jgi:hypothetical protein
MLKNFKFFIICENYNDEHYGGKISFTSPRSSISIITYGRYLTYNLNKSLNFKNQRHNHNQTS